MSSARSLPVVPTKHADFLTYVKEHPKTPVEELLRPYNEYDAVLRQIFAQEPSHPAVADNHVNIVPLYGADGTTDLRVRARDLASEPEEVKEKYIMPLKDEDRRPSGSPAVVPTLKEFQNNFNIFSEGSLSGLDWSNVVVSGSAVATCLLPLEDKYRESKRLLRQYYHQEFAPASDVDVFIYGLNEEQALEKIKHIEEKVKDSILHETTTVRTKHTITIVSQYPTRHVQIVLRMYKSISEILTGFDVDCSCAAYDGQNVFVAPRAAASYMTQVNRIDLTRRSPSYENRLSKYSRRGFEVFWPQLDRSRIDPTIFERNFKRTEGLARLLVLEKLPTETQREEYMQQRRAERGRPPLDTFRRNFHKLGGNIKDRWEDEVAEWDVDDDDVSSYHTFHIPYGEKYHARKIEKLLYKKDLLLNAEWNNTDREVNLHRHPAFFGHFEDVIQDCCGFCPEPVTPEEKEIWEKESKVYISGKMSFLKDDPGRQEIGSFNPITDADWTEMAYVGNTAGLCQAIVDHDLGLVKEWLAKEGADANRRDYTGRTPLHLAAMTSTSEIVQCLVDKGARLIARLADGQTALHLAAARGSVEIVRILLTKSEENEEAEEEKKDQARDSTNVHNDSDHEGEDDLEHVSAVSETDIETVSMATGSFVNVKKDEEQKDADNLPDDKADEPDVYDINVTAWDNRTSPLHLAILNGHTDVVEELVSSFGADVLLPLQLVGNWGNQLRGVILSLALALRLPLEKAVVMVGTLLRLGATPAQADFDGYTPLHYVAALPHTELVDTFLKHDQPGLSRAIGHLAVRGGPYRPQVESALGNAIRAGNYAQVSKLIEVGAATSIGFKEFLKAAQATWETVKKASSETNEKSFYKNLQQPISFATQINEPEIALRLLREGVDPNTLSPDGHRARLENRPSGRHNVHGTSLLDMTASQIRKLKNYRGEPINGQPPTPLDDDDQSYLEPYQEGTYQMAVAKELVKQARTRFENQRKSYEKALEEAASGPGVEEKKRTIETLLGEFEKLHEELLAKGAKSFNELYPDAATKHKGETRHATQPPKSEDAFKVKFSFGAPDLTGAKRGGYVKLFEAAWSGDLETIKSLTLGMWGPDNEEPPLVAATTGEWGFSPFSIAVLRGHLDVAKAILEIVQAQYKPPDNVVRRRFNLHVSSDDGYYTSDEENDSDDSGGEIMIRSEVIQDKLTIDDIGEVSAKVESNVSPLQVFLASCPVYMFASSEAAAQEMRSRSENVVKRDLVDFAICDDNVDLLIYLLELGQSLTSMNVENEQDRTPSFTVGRSTFLLAMRLGRLRCLAELIRRTGVGLPLDELVHQSGAEIKRKPKYYQGLSIHGKKNEAWAAAPGTMRRRLEEDASPPLLTAAHEGSLASVEWFLSTAPGRHYTEFARASKHDKRLKALAKTERGVEESILRWLGLRNNLVLHCAVLSTETDESVKLVEYLIKTVPECLEVKSSDGYTPLSLAFAKQRSRFAKLLVDAGADQTARDGNGNNILHLLLQDHPRKAPDISPLLSLLDSRLVPSLLTERSADHPGSLTPLARWLRNVKLTSGTYRRTTGFTPYREEAKEVDVLRTLLDFAERTGQKHLEVLDGAGNTPVHDAVRKELPDILKLMLERRPDLVSRENASGCTPADLASAAWIALTTRDPPPRVGNQQRYVQGTFATDITGRRPLEFQVGKQDERPNPQIINEICVKTLNEQARGCKRKLVTLFDANEVARRLATRNKRLCRSEDRDVVSQWF